jgi:serine/threonine-protein kinase HipA
MPTRVELYDFIQFPPPFDGLLPEGEMLDGLLRQHMIDSRDYFAQFLVIGGELVGAITIEPIGSRATQ